MQDKKVKMQDSKSKLSENAMNIIKDTLKIKDLNEVVDKKYQLIDAKNDVNKESAVRYSKRVRGSIRLGNLRFYTINEFLDRIKRIKSLILPG